VKSLSISIAGFILKLQSDDSIELSLDDGYLPYIIPESPKKPDIIIHCKTPVPAELCNAEDIIFEARNSEKRFYCICKLFDSYKFIIYDQEKEGVIRQIAILNADFSEWTVYSCGHNNDKVFPLHFPMGPIILYYLTVKYDAIMIHASGVVDPLGGRIFMGFSGSGKSTMAAIWQFRGSTIINDDRLIIRKENSNYVMYNTPMFYPDKPKKAVLKQVHIIHHSPENNMVRISGARAVSKVLAFCIQNDFNAGFIEHHLAFLSEMCSKIPVYEVGFKSDPEIVDYIQQHAV